jgi:predicted RNA-binding protein with PIN domain
MYNKCVPYLIDGHNLIPTIPGFSLSEVDDEARLIDLLQVFCQRERKNAEVFFDKAPAGQARTQKTGRVTARFIHHSRTADAAIRERLAQLGNEAPNWTVVSSDRAVQSSARQVRAQVMPSAEFAKRLFARSAGEKPAERPMQAISSQEVEEWLLLFKQKGKRKKD